MFREGPWCAGHDGLEWPFWLKPMSNPLEPMNEWLVNMLHKQTDTKINTRQIFWKIKNEILVLRWEQRLEFCVLATNLPCSVTCRLFSLALYTDICIMCTKCSQPRTKQIANGIFLSEPVYKEVEQKNKAAGWDCWPEAHTPLELSRGKRKKFLAKNKLKLKQQKTSI